MVLGVSSPSSAIALKGASSAGEISVQVAAPIVVRKTCWEGAVIGVPLNPPSTAYIMLGSLGSKTARKTFRPGGRFRVMLVKVTTTAPLTLSANALVDTNT